MNLEKYKAEIEKIRIENEVAYSKEESSAPLGLMNQIFSKPAMYILEIIQNAIDAGATKIGIRTADSELEISHDGKPFDIENVRALSKLGLSSKGPDSVGFMGIGFKSVFSRFQKVQIRDPNYRFKFDITEKEHCETLLDGSIQSMMMPNLLGMVTPFWDEFVPESYFPEENFQVSFFFSSLQTSTAQRSLIEDLKFFKEVQDDYPTQLAVLAHRGLERLLINDDSYKFYCYDNTIEVLINEDSWKWFFAEACYKPSLKACTEVQRRRNRPGILSILMETEQKLIGLVPLDQDGLPDPPQKGQIIATLPTKEKMCFGIHLQGPWLIDASRTNLQTVQGSRWQEEILEKIPMIFEQYLQWVIPKIRQLKEDYQLNELRYALRVFAYPDDENELSELDKFIWTKDGETLLAIKRLFDSIPILPAYSCKEKLFTTINEFWLPKELDYFLDKPEMFPSILFGETLINYSFLSVIDEEDHYVETEILNFLRQMNVKPYGIEQADQHWPQSISKWRLERSDTDFVEDLIHLVVGIDKIIKSIDSDLILEERWKKQIYALDQNEQLVPLSNLVRFDFIPSQKDLGGSETLMVLGQHLPNLLNLKFQKLSRKQGNIFKHFKCHLDEYLAPVEVKDLLVQHIVNYDFSPVDRDTILKQIVYPSLWLIQNAGRARSPLSHMIVNLKDKFGRRKIADILFVAPCESKEVHRSRQRLFGNPPSLSPIYFQAVKTRFHQHYERQNTVLDIQERLLKHNFLGQKIFQTDTIDIFDFDVLKEKRYYPCLDESYNRELSRSKHRYQVTVHSLTFKITEENQADIHLFFEKNKREISDKLISVKYFYRSEKECYSLKEPNWVTQLKESAWVPTHGNKFYRPDQVLPPTENEDDYEDIPLAKISKDLYERLEKHKVEFGKYIPKTFLLRRLKKYSEEIKSNKFGELIEEFFAMESFSEHLLELERVLKDIRLVGGIKLNQLVRQRDRSLFDGFLIAVEKDSRFERAIDLLEEHSVLFVPKSTNGDQALSYLEKVWGEVKQNPAISPNSYKKFLPKAYDYLIRDIETNKYLRERWEQSKSEAYLLGKENWYSVNDNTKLFIDNIHSATIKLELPEGINFVTMEYLGTNLESQLKTISYFGVLPLQESEYFSIHPGSKQSWSEIDNGNVQRRLIEVLIKVLCQARNKQILTICLVDNIKIKVGKKIIEVGGYVDGKEVFLAGDADDYADEVECHFQAYFSLPKEMQGKITKFFCGLNKELKSQKILEQISKTMEVDLSDILGFQEIEVPIIEIDNDNIELSLKSENKESSDTEVGTQQNSDPRVGQASPKRQSQLSNVIRSIPQKNNYQSSSYYSTKIESSEHLIKSQESNDRKREISQRKNFESLRSNQTISSSKQSRLLSYLNPDDKFKITILDEEDTDTESTTAIGITGEEAVRDYEIQQGRPAKMMERNNPGFDLETQMDGEKHYIEVKSTTGSWGERGVSVSARQFREAIKKRDKWWLYVVEFVGTDEQKIYRLPNPFIRMGNLQIDVAWKGLHQEE